MKSIFILEDEINRFPRNQILTALTNHKLTIATSVPEAKIRYKRGYDVLLLDHDMNGRMEPSINPTTAFWFCKWLVVQAERPRVILHSQNDEGRWNMHKLLHHYGFKHIEEFPFSQEYIQSLPLLVGE